MAAEQRTGWRARLRHAFAVEADGPVEPEPAVRRIVDDLLERIVRRRMTVPASMLLESWRPLGAVSAQMMHALTPFTGVVIDANAWTSLASYVEKRGAIPWMVDRLAELESRSPTDGRASGG
jgi:hypothetical protein